MSAIVLNILLLIFTGASVIVFIFAHPLTALRTGDAFTPEQVRIAANLTQIMLVGQFFFAVSNLFSAILQSYQRFILPSIAPILYNLGIVVGVFAFSGQFGIYSAGIGVILGAFMHMIIQVPLTLKLGFRFRPSFNIRYPGVKELFSLIPPRVLTIGITEIQSLGLGFFATTLGNLSYVVIRLASMLVTLPIRLFGIPISQASLPFLTQESGEKDLKRFRHLVLQSLHQIAFFAFPASVLLLILRIPIVRLIFGTQNFPWATTLMTGRVVAILSISIAAQAMVHLLIRSFHALKDTKTPLAVTSIIATLYLIGSAMIVFYTPWGILGIAFITALVAFTELFLFLLLFERRVPKFLNRAFFIPQFKIILASFLMAIFLYLPFRILDEFIFNTTRTIELILLTITTSTIGMVVYAYFAALFDIRELFLFKKVLTSFDRWKNSLAKTQEVFVESGTEDSPHER